MPSLFFWRRKQDKPVVDEFAVQPVAAEVPVHIEAAPAPAQPLPHYPPAMRQIYALALRDERAVEPHAAPDQKNMALLLTASRAFAQIGIEPRYTPRRPSLLPQLVEALNDEDASLRALSRIVAQDPQLTGNLLRSANSPLYRVSSAPVESVERATAVLGITGLRNLLAESLVQPLTTSDSGTGTFGEVIWEHALYSASSSEAWSGRSQDADPFTAHLLALLHGLGCVAVYRVLHDLYASHPDTRPDAAAIADALDTNAGVTGARIAAHWGLSERTRQALESQSSAAPINDPSPLSQALHFGLLTGAMTTLCRQGKLTEAAALQRIEAAGFEGTQATRIWDRIVRAYVRP